MKSVIIVLSFLIAGLFFASSILADPSVQVTSTVNPTPISPGTDGYVQLTLTNSGKDTATSIQIVGSSSDSSILLAQSSVNLGALANGQTTTSLVKFTVPSSASSGLYNIKFAINICSTGCTEIDQTVVVTVQSPSAAEITSIQPDTLSAGQSATLNFNLVNQGNSAINNIILTWQTPNNELLPLGLSNRQYIASLNGGQSLIIPINVSVGSSVSPGVYPLSVELSYFDRSGIKQNVTSTIGIKVGGSTDFDVAVQQYVSGTLSLSIANIGVNPATSVSVSIPAENNTNYAVTGASSSFLGTLNAGDFTVANFQIAQRATFSRTNGGTQTPSTSTTGFSNSPLVVEISYSDTSGARQVVQKEVSVSLASSVISGTIQRNRGLGLTSIILIVAIIIVAGVLLWYFKFRKKKNFLSDLIAKRFKA